MGDDVEQKVGSDTAPAFESDADGDVSLQKTSVQDDAPSDVDDDGPKIVKICKTCMVSQAGAGEFCGHCGAELVPIRAVRETYVGEVVGEKYKIIDRLGAGGMGEVYLGLNEPLGQRVAVKFLGKKFTADEGIIMRFLNEARSYCKVNHPNAVTLLEYGQHEDGALYLITEFIEGQSLAGTLKETGPFPLDQVISIGTQVCEVLSAAHRQGVIHRDLKPDNIMLMPTSRGRYAAKVLDFGIAKIIDDDHRHGPMTETGSVFGTPEFMSPEQCRGDEADPRSDLYAIGIILFYMATGKLPFKGKNKLIILNKQLHERPPRPSMAREDIEVPAGLESVILKCLNKDPEQRYQSADDLLEALEEAADSGARDVTVGETARLGQGSSEVTESPHETPSHPHITGPDIHESDTVRQGFEGSLHTNPERAAEVELGEFDDSAMADSDLQEVDLAGEWAERESVTYDEPQRWKPAAAIIGMLLVGGVAIWAFGAGGDDASADPDEDGAVAASEGEDLDIDRVLITGQVLGSLTAVEDNLRHGDLTSARRALETTYMWLEDDQLPKIARDKRVALSDKLERFETISDKLTKALDESDCSRARRLKRTLSEISEGGARKFEGQIGSCSEGAGNPSASKQAPSKGGQPAKERGQREPDQQPKEKKEEPKVEKASGQEKAGEEKPEPVREEVPKAEGPAEAEETGSEETSSEETSSAETELEAKEPADKEAGKEEQGEDGGDDLDGGALPPKTLE